MGTPQLPQMTDLANIRDALNLYYYGQVVPTATPSAGLAKEFGDLGVLVSSLQTTLDNRKPPKIIAQATPPASPVTADTVGGLWIDTDGVTTDPTATLAYFWNTSTNAWEPVSGKVLESYPYVWTAAHTFKSTINYFANSAARDAAITAPVAGQFAVVGNRLQVYDGGWKNISLPPGGTSGQAAVKLSNTDFDWGWSNVVTPTGNNTFSGSNTFNGATTFSVSPTMAGATITGTTTVTNLNASGTTGLTTLNVSGVLTQTGQANLNGKTVVKNDAARDSGFFIGTRRVYISSTAPTGSSAGDIWIQG